MNARTSRLFRAALRQGISVLEVLIAIGVATIGLLGVIAMIPYGANQAKLARIQDRAAQVGRNAFREFEVRNMSDPTTWRGAALNPDSSAAGGTPHFRAVTQGTIGTVTPITNFYPGNIRDAFGTFRAPFSTYLRAFCIDPRFVAAYSDLTPPNPINATFPNRAAGLVPADYAFPYPRLDAGFTRPAPLNDAPNLDNGVVRMQRLSLAAAEFFTGGIPRIMSLSQADAIFISPDDLRFARPGDDAPVAPLLLKDNSLPPFQLDDSGNGWNPASATATRSSAGEFSWMATLVPTTETGVGRAMYTLTVVVFYKRELTRDLDNERVVDILHGVNATNGNPYSSFFGGGIGGGDVGLVCRRTFPNPPIYRAEDLDVKRGNWVLLSQIPLPAFGAPRPTVHRWYRVIAADTEIDQANSTTVPNYDGPPNRPMRYVTLQGPDWTPIRSTSTNSTFETQVTIVKNVVAVFEKTVRLETSSPWRN